MVAKTGKKNTKIEESSREDQFVVLLENMRDEIKLVAEGNLMLQESMERGFGEVKREISDIKTEMNDMKTEMRMGFKGMMAESVAIDKKMEKKADKKDLLILEKRVARLESVR